MEKNLHKALLQENNATIENETILLGEGKTIQANGFRFNFEKANRVWETKWGIIDAPAELQEMKTGLYYDNRKWKGIFQRNLFLNLVGRDYVTYPNEEMVEIVYLIVDGTKGLKVLGKPEYTNHGLNCFVQVLDSNNGKVIRGSHIKNDLVNLGMMFRNSLGGGMSLGTDLFSYRDYCDNGAVFGYSDIGTMSIRHYAKDQTKMVNRMKEMLVTSLGRMEEIYQYYEKMTTKKLGEHTIILDKLFKIIPQKYFPDYIQIEAIKNEDKKIVSHDINIPSEAKQFTIWEVFNDFTKLLWHSNDISIQNKTYATKKLHEIVITEISPKRNTTRK